MPPKPAPKPKGAGERDGDQACRRPCPDVLDTLSDIGALRQVEKRVRPCASRVLAGAILVALLALTVDLLLAGIQRLLTPRGLALQRKASRATA